MEKPVMIIWNVKLRNNENEIWKGLMLDWDVDGNICDYVNPKPIDPVMWLDLKRFYHKIGSKLKIIQFLTKITAWQKFKFIATRCAEWMRDINGVLDFGHQ